MLPHPPNPIAGLFLRGLRQPGRACDRVLGPPGDPAPDLSDPWPPRGLFAQVPHPTVPQWTKMSFWKPRALMPCMRSRLVLWASGFGLVLFYPQLQGPMA